MPLSISRLLCVALPLLILSTVAYSDLLPLAALPSRGSRLFIRVNDGASSSASRRGSTHSNNFVPLPDGWSIQPQNAVGIRPARVSASALEHFYETMFSTAAQSFWRDVEPFQRPLIDFGQLLWFVEPGDKTFTVPWHVMAAFAFGMREKTRRGWTNFYEFLLEGPDRSCYTIYLDLKPAPPNRKPVP